MRRSLTPAVLTTLALGGCATLPHATPTTPSVRVAFDAGENWSGVSSAGVAHAIVLTDASGAVLREDLHGAPPPCPVATPLPAGNLAH
jgi:hypothetical protein